MGMHRRYGPGRETTPVASYQIDFECGHTRQGDPRYHGPPPMVGERAFCPVCLQFKRIERVRTP